MFAASVWHFVKAGFEFAPLLIWPLMLLTVVRPLQLPRRGRIAVAALLFLASQKFLFYRIFGGDSFVPELPERLLNLTGWAYSGCMIFFALSCGWALARLHRRLRGNVRLSRIALSVLCGLAFLTAGWGVWEGVRVPSVRRIEVAVSGLPPAFDGFRIVQLTDLHCSSAARKARTQGVVDRANALRPDLVCITGDFVDGSPELRADDLSPLRDLRAPYGVFGCAGNHEYILDYAAWRRLYASWGVTMLDNAHRLIEKDGAQVALGGVTDPMAGRAGAPGPDVRLAFAGAPEHVCRILLQHRPMIPELNAALGVKLQLTGHTHGGAILGVDRLVAHMGNRGYVRGLYDVGDMKLYVCPGTGQWAGFPLRLGVPAEIAEIVLRSSSAHE